MVSVYFVWEVNIKGKLNERRCLLIVVLGYVSGGKFLNYVLWENVVVVKFIVVFLIGGDF